MKDRHIEIAAALLITAIVLMFSGCKAPPQIVTETRTEIVEKVRDTIIYLSDSGFLYAWIECDSAYQAKIAEVVPLPGKFVEQKIVLKNNYIKVTATVDSAEVYARLKDRYQSDVKNETIIVKENYVTGFQWFQIWAARVIALLILVFILLRLFIKKPP
jgi:hypothetical protein